MEQYFLSDPQLNSYLNEGFVAPLDLVSKEKALELGQKLLELENEPDIDFRWRDYKLNLIVPWIDELTRDPRLLDAVESILGPNILVFAVRTFIKRKGEPTYFSPHQDSFCWKFLYPTLATAWIALSEVDEDSGAMIMCKKSHLNGSYEHQFKFGEHDLLQRGQQVTINSEQFETEKVVLNPGQFSLHHPHIVHSSPPNTSDHDRIGLAIRYAAANVRVAPWAKQRSAMLVRGKLRSPHFDLERPPQGYMHPEDRDYRNNRADARISTRVKVLSELSKEAGVEAWPPKDAVDSWALPPDKQS